MNRKTIKIIALLMVICFMSIGCSRITTVEETTEETTTPIETTIAEEFQECTEEEYEKARQDIEIVIQALRDKNSDLLKGVLTYTVKENTPKLDIKIQLAFDMLNGEITRYGEVETKCVENLVYWEERCTLFFTYEIYVSDSKYYLDVCYLPRTDTELDNTGVYSVNLRDYEEDTIYYALGKPSIFTMGGVFSSDQYTMDYNAEQLAPLYREIGFEQRVDLSAAVGLNGIGIEKIVEVEFVEAVDFGCVEYIITDDIGDVYYILTDESGYIGFVYQNEKNGETVLDSNIL